MSNLGEMNLLETLLLLLPGFVTAEVIGIFVLREERKALERVIQALIYTFLAHLLWAPLSNLFADDSATNLIGVCITAIVLGLFFAWTIESDAIHALLRRRGFTVATSRANEWYGAFHDRKQYVILHWKDSRRIFGWPRLFPFQPDKGHILLDGAEWLDGQEDTAPRRRVDYLINVSDIRFVEFVPLTELERRNDD